MSIPPLPRFAGTARRALCQFAGVHSVTAPDLENIIFALGEAIANAIQHSDTIEAIEIKAHVSGDSIVITVADHGRGISAPPHGTVSFPNVFAEAGRGFAIMQRCTDFLEVDSEPGAGTVVTLGRYRRPSQELDTAS
ncbi:MAG: ATP-binding protein [Candidatus Eremiobacteraeota bacterium]|nr:ATP-binding protein [Candidatus Eremiobacteraeota bacterium]MBV8499772.1 ATP-binding protein [Candidatus Eremiobacteraeota bacterium]